MGRKRKRKLKWWLLLRQEEGYPVYVYEPLSNKELEIKKKKGWKCVM